MAQRQQGRHDENADYLARKPHHAQPGGSKAVKFLWHAAHDGVVVGRRKEGKAHPQKQQTGKEPVEAPKVYQSPQPQQAGSNQGHAPGRQSLGMYPVG